MRETFGLRLSDRLPPDPAQHHEVVGIAVLPAAGGGIAVVTASVPRIFRIMTTIPL